MKKLYDIPSQEDIHLAHKAIGDYIHLTPVHRSDGIDKISGAKLFFKCENFQKVGAFKMRGATCATLSLTDEEKSRGIATHSSGNHAQAVALSAKLHGIPAYIVMPSNAPSIKRDATLGYGANITSCVPTLESRESTLREVVNQTGATFIHPYDNFNVIAGQATSAKELLSQVPDLEAVIAPIGGGGLMSGTALACNYLKPQIKVYGAEPLAVNDAFLSLQSGHIIKNTSTDTIADGLKTNLCEKTFVIIQKLLQDILTVEEDEIINAMKLIWERLKLVVEPSAAVPFAVILKYPDLFAGKKTGIILSGGNVDVHSLSFN